MANTTQKHRAGVDWGDREHTVCVVAAEGEVVQRFSAPQTAEGVETITQTLRAVGGLVGVAIETRQHLLVDALRDGGLTVYAVNPKLSHDWGKCLSVNAPKDDHRDAWTLAFGLRMYQSHLRAIAPERPDMHTLALLCEHEQQLIKRRTALVCELEAVLKRYFPAVLAWMPDWAVPAAWDFVRTFPTPQALAEARKAKLCAWFKGHRMALTSARIKYIDERKQVLALAAEEQAGAVHALRATTLADELRALQRGIDEHRRRIQALFARHPQASILASLPGAGPKLAPRLLCIFDACQKRYEGAQGVCELAGTVPVTKQSGRSVTVKFRWACRKSYRDTMHQYAWVSMRRCEWARLFYQNCRKGGQHHALALRNLATKWSKIIYRMCCENAPYDEQRYRAALRRGNSPLAACLEG